MSNNYATIVRNNLNNLYQNLSNNRAESLDAVQEGDSFVFEAFGETCRLTPDRIILGDQEEQNVIGILISLYALHSQPEPYRLEPFKAFKDLPNSMPYVGAYSSRTEHILIPYVNEMKSKRMSIMERLRGEEAPLGIGGDFSFVVYPLPKIALCYIFYIADDEFPASVTALFSNNALTFLPIDALADVGEYSSKKIIEIIRL